MPVSPDTVDSFMASSQTPKMQQCGNEESPLRDIATPRVLDDTMKDCQPSDMISVSVKKSRDLILKLGSQVGLLSSEILRVAPLDTNEASETETELSFENSNVPHSIRDILRTLIALASSLDFSLEGYIRKKMDLNAKKYPAHLCKGISGKYTQYSSKTGITKTEGQSTLHLDVPGVSNDAFFSVLDQLVADIRLFAEERDWTRFHRPRNLTLAILGELGELSELLQYKGDVVDSIPLTLQDKLGQEIADVAIYLIRLADVSNVSLSD